MDFAGKRTFLRQAWVAAVGAAMVIAAATSGESAAKPDPDRYIVKFKDVARGQSVLRAQGLRILRELGPQRAAAVRIPPRLVEILRRNPNIEYIEKDPPRYPMAQSIPYGIPMVQADQVSDASAANRKVCIIDSGYYLGHEDLDADASVTGTDDPGGTGNWDEDGCGHGTHVAGTISALDNSVGVLGVNSGGNLALHIVRVFGDDCIWAYSSDLIGALNVCRGAGANVVSMSLGCSGLGCASAAEEDAFDDADAAGVLSIAAAGNDGTTNLSYPASYDSVVSVAAIDSSKVVASFSQKNSQVELAAPGVGVLSTVPYREDNTLTADATTWNGVYMDGGARTSGTTGALADGAKCTSAGSWAGNVVLCQRGDISFGDKVNNVIAGGGVAAVIYNNAANDASCGLILGTLGGDKSIPAIFLTCADGADALTHVASSGTVVSELTQPASGYEFFNGTSMATPHVSGVAALVWSHNTSWTNAEVRNALQQTAEDLGAVGRDNSYGYGLVRAKAALDYLEATTCNVTEDPEVSCSDGEDNDCDGFVDTNDTDCQPPKITGFSPTFGPVGTAVVVTGTKLSGATAVAFNGTAATFSVQSPTQVEATVPPGATTGPITVTTPEGPATSAASFTVMAAPQMSVLGVQVREGNSGQRNAIFRVWLSSAPAQTVTVDYATSPGTATAGVDYQTTSGTLTFPPMTRSRTIAVPVVGDTAPEPNETFFVDLGTTTGAVTIARGRGTGTIVDDDRRRP